MPCAIPTPLALALALALALGLAPAASRAPGHAPPSAGARAPEPSAQQGERGLPRPGPAPIDVFHPDRRGDDSALPAPRFGGRVIVHTPSLPKGLNPAVENSNRALRIALEIHAGLLAPDWETWELVPVLAQSYDVEDVLVLRPDAAARHGEVAEDLLVRLRPGPDAPGSPGSPDGEGGDGKGGDERRPARVVYGRVVDQGAGYLVRPLSPGHRLERPVEVAKEDVLQLDRGTVVTFHLREDACWHPSEIFRADESLSPEQRARVADQKLDAHDAYFSWTIYSNPEVDCGDRRDKFAKVTRADVVDDHTIRFFYESQYFKALEVIGVVFPILPAHVYDLSDPDNPDFDPEATPSQRAKHVNENPHNRMWVGLGPYRVTEFGQQWIDAERFERYFAPEHAGYVDAIRWRFVPDDAVAFQALLNGELDFFDRVQSADYFGAGTESEVFKKRLYKGYYYLGTYGYTAWNLYRPQLRELAVRRAIAHAFDFDDFGRTYYKDLCNRVTGPFPYFSPAYDRDVEPLAHDPERAIELLEEAGWYDRDGDGVADKDGVELAIELAMPPGNQSSQAFGAKLQEGLAAVGIELTMAEYEWATLTERMYTREFDALSLGWYPPLESDPEQIWHSANGGRDVRSSNNSGLQDELVDSLIRRGQLELDTGARMAIWKQLHRRIYELQPYLFMYSPPVKFAMSRRIRGFQSFALDPGYSIRRWYFTDAEPGTRPTLEK